MPSENVFSYRALVSYAEADKSNPGRRPKVIVRQYGSFMRGRVIEGSHDQAGHHAVRLSPIAAKVDSINDKARIPISRPSCIRLQQ